MQEKKHNFVCNISKFSQWYPDAYFESIPGNILHSCTLLIFMSQRLLEAQRAARRVVVVEYLYSASRSASNAL